ANRRPRRLLITVSSTAISNRSRIFKTSKASKRASSKRSRTTSSCDRQDKKLLALSGADTHKGCMKTMRPSLLFLSISTWLLASAAPGAENQFVGYWGLTLPSGAAGWLGVEQSGDNLKASLMWVAGSVEPTASAELKDGALVMTRNHSVERKDAS